MRKLAVVSIAMIGLAVALLVPLTGQERGRGQGQGRVGQVNVGGTPTVAVNLINGPVPRLADGKPDLTGPWVAGGSNVDIEREGGLKPGELPLQPWAKELRDKRKEADEPYTACLPMSVPRVNPYPWKFAMSYTSKGLTHIYILHETGDAGAHRVIYMDGRKHPVDPLPTWWGHSIGRWDGDTLVVDTIGYNDKFWFDSRGTPHTEKLHTIERFTRVNYGTLVDEFTLDDPGALTKPVTLRFTARLLRPDLDLMEFICNENNQYGLAGGFKPGSGTGNKQ